MNPLLQKLAAERISLRDPRFISIGGGSINQTFRIESGNSRFFCKINSAKKFPGLFHKEENGLTFLRNTKTIKVPEVIWCGEFEEKQVLILEWIEQGLQMDLFWKKFGEELANLHQKQPDDPNLKSFGFHEDNYMGALEQINTPHEHWVDFFINCRLVPQLQLASQNGLVTKKDVDQFNQLYKKLETIFPTEAPAALHGDLWSGNYLSGKNSEPVLIDPAVYYGHRSIDLGMTKLFGGFDEAFYAAYHYYFPLPKNFEEQTEVCNLYPLLIHLNLFGSGYLSSIRGTLKHYI